MRKVSDYVVQFLLEQGVRHVFTLPGGFSGHLNDSIGHSDIEPIYCLHESAAVFAACGYAAYTQGLGVCVVTAGPGQTNCVTGLASAWQDSLPVLVISGDAMTPQIRDRERFQLRQGGQQDVDIVRIVAWMTKWHSVAGDTVSVGQHLPQAVRFALTPRRGPVLVSIPLDVQGREMG